MRPGAPAGVEASLWRALGVFRVLTYGYALLLYARAFPDYERPALGWVVIAAMGGWTVLATVANNRLTWGRSWPFHGADMTIAVASMLSTRLVDTVERIEAGETTLPSAWITSAVFAWAITGGLRWGVAGAAITSVAVGVERWALPSETVHGMVLLFLSGVLGGYMSDLIRESERTLARALRVEAAIRERERLARRIHDGVLQVLALVQRRGSELGGEAAQLGRLAGEQEIALRTLVSAGHDADSARSSSAGHGNDVDLRSLIRPLATRSVTVSAPGTPVLLPAGAAFELAGAVTAALDNVRRHAGAEARAWVLLEEEPDAVVVSVRDDGEGIPPGRLESAASEGRLGVAQSIRGRLADLGGQAVVTSAPGEGTDVELRLPRARIPGVAVPGVAVPDGGFS